MTDPEDFVSTAADEFAEREVDLAEEDDWPVPLEAEPADAREQQLEVPEDDEDDYR